MERSKKRPGDKRPQARSLMSLLRRKRRMVVVVGVALVFGGLAVLALAQLKAATFVVSLEAEAGNSTGNSTVKDDTNASQGKSVIFGNGTTTPPTNPPATNDPQPYPEKAVAVYHMMWSSSGSPPLKNLPAKVNVVNLAFAQGDPPSLVGWASDGESGFISAAKELRSKGVRIVLSIGGSGGNVNISNKQAFVNGVMSINSKIPLDGLDWDLEGPAMNSSDVVWISTELKKQRGANFAITMAPNGGNIDQYRSIAVALNNAGALDMIGQQFYDAVVSESAMMGRLDQLRSAGIPENKMGIGMMVGDANTYWTVSECISAVNTAKAKYPGIRGGYLWEHGRSGTSDWANQVGALLLK